MNRVSHVDGFARKALGDLPLVVGYRIEKLSHEAARAGVPTPSLTFRPTTRELIAPWIDGYNGRELLQRYMKGNPGFANVPKTYWVSLLEPLTQLHHSKLNNAVLTRLDPYRRIRPRLANKKSDVGINCVSREMRLYQTLTDIGIHLLLVHDMDSWIPVHGDFHVGQVMFGTNNNTPILLDLDDLALGLPESDIGNCIAHLVTSFDDVTNRVIEKFIDLKHSLLECYVELTSNQLAPALVDFYGAVALLRRMLKLSERHGGLSLECMSSAVEVLAESCRGELVK